jgi:hypothetical protein
LGLNPGCTRLEPGSDTFDVAGRGNGQSGTPEGGTSGVGPARGGGDAGGRENASVGGAGEAAGDSFTGAAGDDSGVVCAAPKDRPDVAIPVVEREPGVFVVSVDRLTCENNWLLKNKTFAESDLTIDAGTVVKASEDAFLMVQRDAQLIAMGERDKPIVFTSANAKGARDRGDWRGIFLAGRSVTQNGPQKWVPAQGVSSLRATFGDGPSGDSAGSCGNLQYLRIEFASDTGGDEGTEPKSALTLGGCGKDTVLDHVQVHYCEDCLGFIGGYAGARHLVVTQGGRAGLRWFGGWRGNVQFAVVQMTGVSVALRGVNQVADSNALPRSDPKIYNVTLVNGTTVLDPSRIAVSLDNGSYATVRDGILQGFDVAVNATLVGSPPPPASTLGNLLLHDIGVNISGDAAKFADGNTLVVANPGLPTAHDPIAPVFVPTRTTTDLPASPPAPFDASAEFMAGVGNAGEGVDWTQGWASYPAP